MAKIDKATGLGKVEFRRPEFDPKARLKTVVGLSREAMAALTEFCASVDKKARDVASEAVLKHLKKESKR
jgi:hypothetical protein